jgi:hypothetical protein
MARFLNPGLKKSHGEQHCSTLPKMTATHSPRSLMRKALDKEDDARKTKREVLKKAAATAREAAKRQELEHLMAIIIQCHIRGRLGRLKAKEERERQRILRFHTASALIIQPVWRGWRSRQDYNARNIFRQVLVTHVRLKVLPWYAQRILLTLRQLGLGSASKAASQVQQVRVLKYFDVAGQVKSSFFSGHPIYSGRICMTFSSTFMWNSAILMHNLGNAVSRV